jgi:hypothetical protein
LQTQNYDAIPFIPEYTPKKEEFDNPIDLIISLKKRFEGFGAVKIIAPKEWLGKKEVFGDKVRITVRRQVIQDLAKGKVCLLK